MAKTSNKLEWCVVKLGQDMNWWVEEISDPISWDLDGLGIVDPRQVSYILDLLDPMREYGLKDHFVEEALFKFKIEKDLGAGRIRLIRVYEDILESEEPLFALPDVIDDEKGAYADFLDHVTKVRVKMLNDLIDFKKQLTEDELEDEIREEQQSHFLEGRAIHPFKEIADILEYVPEGFELDLDEEAQTEAKETSEDEAIGDDIPDLDEDETLEEDETMRWDDDEDEEGEEEGGEEDYEDEESEEEEEESPKKPSRRR